MQLGPTLGAIGTFGAAGMIAGALTGVTGPTDSDRPTSFIAPVLGAAGGVAALATGHWALGAGLLAGTGVGLLASGGAEQSPQPPLPFVPDHVSGSSDVSGPAGRDPRRPDEGASTGPGSKQKNEPGSQASKGPKDVAPRNRPEPTNDIRVVYKAGLEELLDSSSKDEAEELFNNDKSYVVALSEDSMMPEGWKSHSAIAYTSFEDFQKDAKDGFPKHVEAVLYNNEEWSWTPEHEKANAEDTARKFKELAHEHGLTFIAAPQATGEDNRLFAGSAKHADILDVQLQEYESSPEEYARRVQDLAGDARRANPDVTVISQITSAPDKLRPAADDGVATTGEIDRTVSNIESEHAPDVDGFVPWIMDTPAGERNAVAMIDELAERKRER